MSSTAPESTYAKIYRVVMKIPEGKVATYGQIARIAGFPGRARQVGYALHALPENSGVPWFRVVNSKGEVSFPLNSEGYTMQLGILEAEGIIFSPGGKIDLKKFQWKK